jgi:hypothetical protein
MSIVSLVIAPTLAGIYSNHEGTSIRHRQPETKTETTMGVKTPSVRTGSALTAR